MSTSQQILKFVQGLQKSGVGITAGVAAIMAQYSLSTEIATSFWNLTTPTPSVSQSQWPGIGFPWGPDPSTLVTPKSDPQMLETSMEMIVLTRKGERCMLPEFGSDIPDLPFEPNDQQTVNQANSSVSSAVGAWDDRIKFVKMDGQIKENELDFQITIQNAKSPNKDATQVVNIQVTPSIVGGM